jgi:mono/diheme cytochrome c family protein
MVLLIAGIAGTSACGSAGPGANPGPDGRAIFRTAGCAGCHTLAAAGSHGVAGPNLDTSTPRPTRESVLFQLRYGAGGMPSFQGKLTRREMEAVAAFVARNAGRRVASPRRQARER